MQKAKVNMEKHRVILATRVRLQLLYHASFISRVSPNAAKRFLKAFSEVIKRLKDNPFQFPVDQVFVELNLPYRKALFEGRYKILFTIEGLDVFVDSVVDCRQQ